MPKYSFKCPVCDNTTQKYVASSTLFLDCSKCSSKMRRQMPRISNTDVTETVNKYTGLKHKQDHSTIMNARKDEYYWTVEVPRMVASGTYSLETMLENGWVYFDDKKQMHIQNKPPHKR